LERTVQELNAALVMSRNGGSVNRLSSDGSSVVDETNGSMSVEPRIIALQMDLDTANSHLALERERVSVILSIWKRVN
jgi:hypothetical protein